MARNKRKLNKPIASTSQPVAPTSWEPIAKWYEKWSGENGSEHHRRLAIPTVLELLDARPGEKILDIGCGNGVLAPHIAKAGATYMGVDASPKLVAYAQKRHASVGTFLLGDARQLPEMKGLNERSADATVFMLSIQDMEPLASVLESAEWATNANGRIVLLMTHPCFHVPRQSGWGWDEGRKLQYRRVDRYLTPLAVPVRPLPKGQSGAIHSFHRPLQDYVNGLVDCGFLVDRSVEIPTFPGIVRHGRRAKAENMANGEIPVFLGLRARKRHSCA